LSSFNKFPTCLEICI